MGNVRKSIFIALSERYVLIILQVLSFLILARLLTPEDIGLYSVSAAFIGLAHLIRDFGIGSYLVQEKNLTLDRKRTAFTITLIIGLSFFLVIQLLSTPISNIYNDHRMQSILHILAFNFLLIPFNSVTLSVLRRDMKFNVLLWINISAAIISTATAIFLASLDFGYMSLVWSSIANTATTCLGGLAYRRGEFWMRPTLKEKKRILGFGSKITITSITSEISSSSNDIFAGRFLGFEVVGLISRAMGVMYLFHRDITSAIRGVAFPVFAKSLREKKDIEEQYVTSVIFLTAVAFPFYGFFSIFPLESLHLLFGPQWDAAAPLVAWFCLAGAVASTNSLIPTLLMAHGEASILVRFHLVIDPLRIITFFLALYFYRSPQAYAIVFLTFFIVSVPYMYYLKDKVQPTKYAKLTSGILKSIYSSSLPLLITFTASILITRISGELAPLWIIPLAALTVITWVISLIIFHHPITNDIFFIKIMKKLRITCQNIAQS